MRFSTIVLVLTFYLTLFHDFSYAQDPKENERPRLFKGGLLKRFENLQEKIRNDREKKKEKAAELAEKRLRKKNGAKKNEAKKKDPVKTDSSRRSLIESETAPGSDIPEPGVAEQAGKVDEVNLGIVVTQKGIVSPGLLVEKVEPNSPAESAGLKVNDRIVAFGGTSIRKVDDLKLVLDAFVAGDRTEVELVRDGKKRKTLVEFPAGDSQLELNPPSQFSSGSRSLNDDDEILPEPKKVTESPKQDTPLPLTSPDRSKRDVPKRAGLGVVAITVDPAVAAQSRLNVRQGALLEEVKKDSAADKSGLKPGDVVIAVDGRRVDSAVGLSEIVQMYQPGDSAQILYYQGNRLKRASTKFDALPVTELTFGSPNPPLGLDRSADNRDKKSTPFGNRILEGLSDDFPRLKRVDDLIQRFTPNPDETENSKQSSARVEKRPRDADLENELMGLRNRIRGQDQQIKDLTSKLNALEKLLNQKKNQ